MSSKAHRGKDRRPRTGPGKASTGGPKGRKPVAPPGKVEKPARGYDRRDEKREVDEQTPEEQA